MSAFKELMNRLKHKKHPPRDAAAVAAKVGREKLGQKEMTRRSVAGREKHHSRESVPSLFAEDGEESPFKKMMGRLQAAKQSTPSSPEAKEKMHKTMSEFKHGTLHSGSKHGPEVTNRAQAIAIGLNQARKAEK